MVAVAVFTLRVRATIERNFHAHGIDTWSPGLAHRRYSDPGDTEAAELHRGHLSDRDGTARAVWLGQCPYVGARAHLRCAGSRLARRRADRASHREAARSMSNS